MERDHAIRLAVRGLQGKARERAIDYLTRWPQATTHILKRKLVQSTKPRWSSRRGVKRDKNAARVISWNMRFTPEEYLEFKARAERSNLSMAQLMRFRLGLTTQQEDYEDV